MCICETTKNYVCTCGGVNKSSTLDLSKPVQTRSGRSVRILCTDKRGDYSIVGLCDVGEFQVTKTWTRTGRIHNGSALEYFDDLVNVPPPKLSKTVYVHLTPSGGVFSSPLLHPATYAVIIGTKKVTITEGDFE